MKWSRLRLVMEIHQLRYFVAAAEEMNISAAARRLHVSQPALSRQVAALEEELGVALFDRVKKRIRLTEAGRFFLPRARQILCDLETAAQQVAEEFGKARRTLRLGFLPIFLDDLVAPALRALRAEAPRVEVALFELSPRAQLDRLRDGELDLGVLGNLDAEDRERFAVTCLMRSRIEAVVSEDHRLAGRKQISLTEMSLEPFVSLSDTAFPGRRRFLQEICRGQGFEPEIVEESDSLTLMLATVASGAGVALLPRHSRKLPHAGTRFVPLKTPRVHAEVLAVEPRGGEDRGRRALIGHLAAAAARIEGGEG